MQSTATTAVDVPAVADPEVEVVVEVAQLVGVRTTGRPQCNTTWRSREQLISNRQVDLYKLGWPTEQQMKPQIGRVAILAVAEDVANLPQQMHKLPVHILSGNLDNAEEASRDKELQLSKISDQQLPVSTCCSLRRQFSNCLRPLLVTCNRCLQHQTVLSVVSPFR